MVVGSERLDRRRDARYKLENGSPTWPSTSARCSPRSTGTPKQAEGDLGSGVEEETAHALPDVPPLNDEKTLLRDEAEQG